MAVISSDCSSVENQFQGWVPASGTSRNHCYPSLVRSSALLANSYVDSWLEWENLETSEGQHSIEPVYEAGAPTSVGRTIVAMIVVEDLTKGSCTTDSFLEAREEVARSCGGGFSTAGPEDAARHRDRPYGEGSESAESSSVNETHDKAPHRQKYALELAWCSFCSSSGSRFHVAEAGREGLGSLTHSWAE